MVFRLVLDNMLLFQDIVAFAKEYGFIFQSSQIYGGIQAVYDYGHYGVLLKRNIKNAWWKAMIQMHNNIVGIDASILMHPTVWKASGHVDNFDDLMIDNKDSKKRYRVDMLIEDYADQLKEQGQHKHAQDVIDKMNLLMNNNDLDGLYSLIKEENIICSISKTANWTDVRHLNLMFCTQVDDENIIYLRPETAQGIYVNFLNIQRTTHMKIPFGIAQIGKAFRNEIIARQFTFRMREFEQMEMQYFIQPDTDEKWFEYWKQVRMNWYKNIGINPIHLHFKPHDKLAHYAKAAVDIEYEFPFGFKEIEGIHSRGDYDLSNHEHFSTKKIRYFDSNINESYIPHVIETSIGCDRAVLMVLCEALTKVNDDSKGRIYLNFNKDIAPIKCAILPLKKKDGLDNKALEIYKNLSEKLMASYDDSQDIGTRYERNDRIGTPYCITVDYQTLDDDTVTVRDRNTTYQERVKRDCLYEYMKY